MTKTKILPYDVAEHLDSDEMIAAYLNAALEENDTDFFFRCLDDVIRAKGITNISKKTGLGRESLYKAFAKGSKPRYETVLKVSEALGLHIEFKAA